MDIFILAFYEDRVCQGLHVRRARMSGERIFMTYRHGPSHHGGAMPCQSQESTGAFRDACWTDSKRTGELARASLWCARCSPRVHSPRACITPPRAKQPVHAPLLRRLRTDPLRACCSSVRSRCPSTQARATNAEQGLVRPARKKARRKVC